MEDAPLLDRRSARTRRAINSAFLELLGERRYEDIDVLDVTKRADVGRSTFYEHFRGKTDLLCHSIKPVFATIAAAGDPGAEQNTRFIVAHLWDNRRLSRILGNDTFPAVLRRALTQAVEAHLRRRGATGDLVNVRAIQIAGAQLALLEAWSRGEIQASQETVAARICAAAAL
jgi:AcrR family transcriptional regulator